MSSKYEEILEEARKKFEQILEEFEKQETRGGPMKPDPFDVTKLAELLSNLSKEEVQEKEPIIKLSIYHSDFEILINFLADKIRSVMYFSSNPLWHSDFLRMVNIFNYMYFNENYKKTDLTKDLRQKLITLFKGTLYESMCSREN